MGLLSRRGRAHPEPVQCADSSPVNHRDPSALGSKPPTKLAPLPQEDVEDTVDADNIGLIITPRGSISSCDGQPLSPNRRSAPPQPPPAAPAGGRMVDLSGCTDGAPLVIPALQPTDPAELDALVASMLEAQGEKGTVRARVFALPPEHKWALLSNYKTLQQQPAAAAGSGGGGGGTGGGAAEDEPESWVRALQMQPELDALQHLAVLLRTLPLQ
jgi:hypothetical protein